MKRPSFKVELGSPLYKIEYQVSFSGLKVWLNNLKALKNVLNDFSCIPSCYTLPSLLTLQRVYSLKHDDRTFSTRFQVSMEPKQQELVGY